MKYENKIIYKDGQPFEMVFEFENLNNSGVLQMFLGEVSNFPERIKEQIKLVLEGKEELVEGNGNCCSWDFEPEDTDIWDVFDDNDKTNHIVVKTKDLNVLIDEWLEARKKFKKTIV